MRKINRLFFVIAVFITACSPARTVSFPTATLPAQTPLPATSMPTSAPTATRIPVGITEIANLGKGSAEFVDWSPDGKLYSIGGSLGVRIFDAKTHAEIKFLPYPVASGIIFSKDSQSIGIGGWSDVKIVRVSDGSVLLTVEGVRLFGITFSPDGHSFAYISRCDMDCRDSIHVWDIAAGKETLALDEYTYSGVFYNQVSFDATGTLLYAAASDNLIHVWDIATGKPKYTLKGHTNEVLGFIFSPDGNYLASYGKDFRAIVWNLRTKQPYRTIVGYQKTIKKITFSSDGSHLSVIFDDNVMFIRNLATGETVNAETYVDADANLLQQLRSTGYIDYVDGLAYSPDGQTLAVSSSGSAPVLLWDIPSQKVRATLDTQATQLLYSHRGDFLASLNDDSELEKKTVSIWDTRTHQKRWTLKTPFVDSMAYSPDDSTLAIGSNGKIDLWDVQRGLIKRTITTKGEWVEFLAYSSDGNILSSAATQYVQETHTSDFFVQSWNVATGNLVHEYIPLNNNLGIFGEIIGFHNDILVKFKYLGGFTDNTAELWDINTGQQTHILKGINDYTPPTLAFTPNAQVVAICYRYGITFYNTSTGQAIYAYDKEAHCGAALSFSPDGNSLAIGDADGSINLWDVSRIVQASPGTNP